MAEPALDIEWVVQEVVRRLAAQTGAAKAEIRSSTNGKHTTGDLHVPAQVVSLARLEGRLAGVKRIVVQPGAIITPAVRDELRANQITIAEAAQAGTRTGKLGLVCGLADTTFEPSGLLRTLAAETARIETLARTGMNTVLKELIEHVVRGGSLGLLLTSQPAYALCAANRNANIRAAQSGCLISLKDAIAAVGVNLLVLNPTGKSSFELQRIVNLFVREGGHCPASFGA